MAWTSGVNVLDSIVQDYLLRRGFNNTLKSLETEIKQDKGFQADKLLQHLLSFISNHDIDGLLNYWKHLERKIFSLLEQSQHQTVKKVELNLYRLYLVTCVQNGKMKECHEFFEKLTPELQSLPEWREWFTLPYIKNPEITKPFTVYFTKQWAETFTLSLFNFLGIVLSNLNPPRLVEILEKNSKSKAKASARPTPSYVKALGVPGSLHTAPQTVEPQEKRKLPFSTKKLSLGISKSNNQPKEPHQQAPKQQEPEPSSSVNVVESRLNSRAKKSSGYQIKRKELFGDLTSTKEYKKVENFENRSSPKQESIYNGNKIQVSQQTNASPKNETRSITDKSPLSSVVNQSPKNRSTNTTPSTALVSNGGMTVKQHPSRPNPTLTLKSTETYQEHHSAIVQCRFNPTTGIAASCDNDGIVKLWQNSPITTISSLIAKSHFQSIEWAKSSPNLLLLGATNGMLRVYDANTKQTMYDTYLNGDSKLINQIKCQPYSNKLALSCINDEQSMYNAPAKMQIWSLSESKLSLDVTISSSNVTCICFNDSGSILASGDTEGNVTVSSSGNFKVITTKKIHAGPVNTIRFAEDGKHLYTIGSDGKLRCWNILTRDGIVTFPIHPMAAGPFEVSGFSGYKQTHQPRGGQLFDLYASHVVTCDKKTPVIYRTDIQTSALDKALTLDAHRAPVLCVDYVSSKTDTFCLSGSMDGHLHLSRIDTQEK
uniref:WD repeat-containing protein 91 n=1 Tax=Phallusia mammillata TaxID=59560 RepID=A0A6F9DXP1_9ASCI|nr:WD repeat-containing protein 91 [Phallusia mammillata]